MIPSSPIKAQLSPHRIQTFKPHPSITMLQLLPLHLVEGLILRLPNPLKTGKTLLRRLSSAISSKSRPSPSRCRINPPESFLAPLTSLQSTLLELERIHNPAGVPLEVAYFKYMPRRLERRLYPTLISCLGHSNHFHYPAQSTYSRARNNHSS